MKRKRSIQVFVTMLIMIMTVTACAKKDSSSYDNSYNTGTTGSSVNYTEAEPAVDDVYTSEKDMQEGAIYGSSNVATEDYDTSDSGSESVTNSSSLDTGDSQIDAGEKIIKRFYLNVETQAFDQLIADLNEKINLLGGYVESSSIGGKSFYDNNVTRSGNIVARIPSNKVDEFVGAVDEEANVIRNERSTENVTLQYVDAQSRIKALEIEQDRLFAILEKTESLDSIITLESRLSEIRYELQNYESQLRTYDNQVQYSTVTMNISEVERITQITEEKPTFLSRIKTGFSDSIYRISEGFKNFIVWLIVNLPYLLIWGIIIFVIALIARRSYYKLYPKKNTGLSDETLKSEPLAKQNKDENKNE